MTLTIRTTDLVLQKNHDSVVQSQCFSIRLGRIHWWAISMLVNQSLWRGISFDSDTRGLRYVVPIRTTILFSLYISKRRFSWSSGLVAELGILLHQKQYRFLRFLSPGGLHPSQILSAQWSEEWWKFQVSWWGNCGRRWEVYGFHRRVSMTSRLAAASSKFINREAPTIWSSSIWAKGRLRPHWHNLQIGLWIGVSQSLL